MTISYNLDISSSTNAFTFLRILFRWRGSVWKSVLNEFIAWTVMYYIVFAVYRFMLTDDDQKAFEHVARHINEKMSLLPLTFMLGFFVKIVVDRWKEIFQNIGFIDSPAFFVNTYIRGDEPDVKTIRKNIIRIYLKEKRFTIGQIYLCLTQVLVLRDISIQVRKRFPNMESLVDSRLLQFSELEMIENVQNGFPKYWMPINWIFSLCYEMRQKGHIAADVLLNGLLQEIKYYRENLQNLCNYDWVPVPLAYPQVVFLAVRIYFVLCLFGRQYRLHENAEEQNQVDRVLPFLTMLQLLCFMGWLKVAEFYALLNPLGEDDDNFECNYIIDRNIAIALTMVDECHDQKPPQQPGFSLSNDPPLCSDRNAQHHQNPLVGSATLSNLGDEKQNGQNKPSISNRHIRHLRKQHSLPSDNNVMQPVRPTNLEFILQPNGTSPARPISLIPGSRSMAACPEFVRQFSTPNSAAELRSLQMHHLELVREDREEAKDPSELKY